MKYKGRFWLSTYIRNIYSPKIPIKCSLTEQIKYILNIIDDQPVVEFHIILLINE